MVALLLVAVSLGLGNFAAAVGLGTGGVDARVRLRVGLVFGAFEAGMPVIGLFIGDHVAGQLGQATRWIGGALLVAVGLYGLLSDRERPHRDGADRDASREGESENAAPADRGARLLLSGLALSVDNLVAGFALGTAQIGILAGALIIGLVSAALSLAGLELGAWLGSRVGGTSPGGHPLEPPEPGARPRTPRSAWLGSLMLIAVGIAVAFGLLG